MHCCRDSTPGERETAPSLSPIHLRPVWLRPEAVKNKWHGSGCAVDLAVAAATQDLPLQIFVFEKCTFTTLSNVFAPANVPFAAAALLSQLRDCTCKINFQATKVPVSAATNIFSSEGADFEAIVPFVLLRLQNLKQICSFNGEKQFDTAKVPPVFFSCKNQVVVAKCMLELQTQTCT